MLASCSPICNTRVHLGIFLKKLKSGPRAESRDGSPGCGTPVLLPGVRACQVFCQVSPSPQLPCTGPALGFRTWYEARHLLSMGEEREDADTPTGLMTRVSPPSLPPAPAFSAGDFGQFPIPGTVRVSGFPEGVRDQGWPQESQVGMWKSRGKDERAVEGAPGLRPPSRRPLRRQVLAERRCDQPACVQPARPLLASPGTTT